MSARACAAQQLMQGMQPPYPACLLVKLLVRVDKRMLSFWHRHISKARRLGALAPHDSALCACRLGQQLQASRARSRLQLATAVMGDVLASCHADSNNSNWLQTYVASCS